MQKPAALNSRDLGQTLLLIGFHTIGNRTVAWKDRPFVILLQWDFPGPHVHGHWEWYLHRMALPLDLLFHRELEAGKPDLKSKQALLKPSAVLLLAIKHSLV